MRELLFQSSVFRFWIPFAGKNREKLGTRIELDPDMRFFYVSRNPERRQRGDRQIANSGRGLRNVFDVISRFVAGHADLEQVFFDLCSEFLLSHQQRSRQCA